MSTAKDLLIEFEKKLWLIVGDLFPKSIPKDTKISYIVQYQHPDKSCLISIMATTTNELNIAFYKVTNEGIKKEVYVTPYIGIAKIGDALNCLYNIINDSAYKGHEYTIEEYVESFKRKFMF